MKFWNHLWFSIMIWKWWKNMTKWLGLDSSHLGQGWPTRGNASVTPKTQGRKAGFSVLTEHGNPRVQNHPWSGNNLDRTWPREPKRRPMLEHRTKPSQGLSRECLRPKPSKGWYVRSKPSQGSHVRDPAKQGRGDASGLSETHSPIGLVSSRTRNPSSNSFPMESPGHARAT